MSSETFDTFYKDLKATEKADAVLTPKQQIDRLLRPGSTYRNLNPYEVLQIDPKLAIEDVRKKYRRLSILVHPDKNQDDPERAQAAFDAVKKAYALLDDEKTRKKCEEIVEEAEGRTLKNMEEKRKKLVRENKGKGLPSEGPHNKIDEDDPAKFKQSVHILTMKLFADLERRRRQLEQKVSDEAARKRESEIEAEERKNVEKEFAKNWEESRQGRVNSWLNFKWGKTTPGTSSTPGQPPLPSGPPLPPEPPKPTRPIVPGMQTHRGFVPMTKPGMQPPAPGRFAPMQARPPGPPGMGGSSFARPPVPPQEPAEKKKKKKEKRFNPMGFRPPKHKPESRFFVLKIVS